MRCIDDGRLRASLDGDAGGLTTAERAALADHLRNCPSCAARRRTLQAEAVAVGATLVSWLPEATVSDQQSRVALTRFQATIRREERDRRVAPASKFETFKEWAMHNFRHLNAARNRRIAAVAAMMAILGLVLALAPVNSLADQLFKTFRVQQFQAITVHVPSMTDLPQPRQLTETEQSQIAALLGPLGTPTTNATKDSFREVANQAAAQAFFTDPKFGRNTFYAPKGLPASFASSTARYGTADPTSSTYTLNAKVAQDYLKLTNMQQLNALPWPQGVDQLTFGLDTGATVATFYGDEQHGFGIAQMASFDSSVPGVGPILKFPAEFDVKAFRAAILALPGLPADTVAQIKAIDNISDDNWMRTLIIPVPDTATSKPVTVSGRASGPGLLVTDEQGTHTLLVWHANGMLLAIGGDLTGAEVMDLANNLTTP